MFEELLEPLRKALGSELFEFYQRPSAGWTPLRSPIASAARTAAWTEANALARDQRYSEALDLYLLIVAIDGTGSMTFTRRGEGYLWQWDPRTAIQAHGVLKSIAKSANVLGLQLQDLKLRFESIATEYLTSIQSLRPPNSVDQIWASAEPDLAEHVSTRTAWRPRLKIK